MNSKLLGELKAIVGASGWSSDPSDLEPHLTEWRGLIRGETPIMVSPATTEQVSKVLEACHRHGVGVVPQGGNTGLCGGAIPDTSGEQVLLSLSKLNRIRSVDAEDFTMTVEAGCILADVQAAARAVNRLFPLSLGAEGSCQIGGNLSTNAGGINVIRYGTARDQVLGLEVVLADGTIWNGLRALRKDTAGYDMKQVFVGSEGTLGVITAATLKLYPDPGEITTVMLAIPSAGCAVPLLAALRGRVGDRIQAFELISNRCLRYVTRHISGTTHPFADTANWYVLAGIAAGKDSGALECVLEDSLADGLVTDAIVAKSLSEADRLWHMRHSISEAQRPEGAALKHDISVPVSKLSEFIDAGQEVVETMLPGARLVVYGHIGDGNLHYNVLQPTGSDAAEFRASGQAITEAIYDLAIGMGGSISAEHGIGVMKKAALRRYRDATEIGMMRDLKKALDPRNILNPGKVI